MNTWYVRVRALIVGGNLGSASSSGLQAWVSSYAASSAGWSLVSRSNLYSTINLYSYVSLALAKIHDYLSLCVSRIFRTLREDISL